MSPRISRWLLCSVLVSAAATAPAAAESVQSALGQFRAYDQSS